jgi:O-antigen/teichoic acid export membrane protein
MTTADVGIFGIGYRLATVTSLLMAAFQTAITPLVYQRYREVDAPAQLAGVFRAFAAVALGLSLALAMFANEAMRIFTTPPFYAGATVVPLLAPALILSGMYVLAPGLTIAKRTGAIAVVSGVGALLNTSLNLALIPLLGIRGAALATFLGAASTFAAYMLLSQRLYPVPHRWRPLGLAAAGSVAIFIATRSVEGIPMIEPLVEVGGLAIAGLLFVKLGLLEPAPVIARIRAAGSGTAR